MNKESPTSEANRRGWLLQATDQATVAGFVVLALAAIAGSWIYRGSLIGRTIDIENVEPQRINFQLDINQAPWSEWTVLPRIGEVLAKRIAESREADGPFRDHEDLTRVRGIGPRTLEQIRPYLLPMPDDEPVAAP